MLTIVEISRIMIVKKCSSGTEIRLVQTFLLNFGETGKCNIIKQTAVNNLFTAVCLQTYFDRHPACIIAITSSCRCTRLKRSTLHVP